MIRTTSIAVGVVAAIGLIAMGGCASQSHHATHTHAAATSTHQHEHAGTHAHDHQHHQKHAHSTTGHDDAQRAHDHMAYHPAHDPQAPCTCTEAKLHNGWCKQCNVGYVAGYPIQSASLFEAVDPHGHDINVDQLRCATCQAAVKVDGYCSACGMGFYDQQAYFTPLTHGLAHAHQIDPTALSCSVCKANAAHTSWCDACLQGMVGNAVFHDRATFHRMAGEFEILLAAIDYLDTCDMCARAMVAHRRCPRCNISYATNTDRTLDIHSREDVLRDND